MGFSERWVFCKLVRFHAVTGGGVERQFGRSHDPCQIPSLAQTIHAVAHSCPVAQCPATVAPQVLASGKSGGGVFLFSDD